MKTYLSIVAVALLSLFNQYGQAQCINGNCEEGTGSMILKNGTYTGLFKNGLPNRKGVFTGHIQQNRYLDSVQDEGNFVDGFFMNGERKILASWELYFDVPANAYLAARGYRKQDGYWVVPKEVVKPVRSYPEKDELVQKSNGKERKQDVWEYAGVNKSYMMIWTGKLKNGLPHGEGEIKLRGEGWDKSISINFDKGIPTGTPVVTRWDIWERKYYLSTFSLKDGLVDEQIIMIGEDTIFQKPAASLFYMLQTGILGSPDGYFTRKNKDGSSYTGELKNGLYHGLGTTTYTNGNIFQGFFYENYRNGPGKFIAVNGAVDSGFYYLGKFIKGSIRRPGQPTSKYPLCVSGNCENGIGKAQYIIYSDTLYDVYNGNFVNGLPAGYGEWQYRRGDYSYSKKGTFATGRLNGYAEVSTSGGVIRRLKGNFENDTLIGGTIYYFDGSSFESERFQYRHTVLKTMQPVIFGVSNKKELGGPGIYRSAGTVLTGNFNPFYNTMMIGTYQNAAGIVINNFGVENDPFKYMRLASVAFDVDRIDNYVSVIVAQIKWDQQQRIEAEKAYALKRERERAFEAHYSNPANFRNSSESMVCKACNGAGRFEYTNTFGGNVEREVMNNRGDWVKVVIERTGRTYTRKVTCDACNGKGRISVSKKTYTGPAY